MKTNKKNGDLGCFSVVQLLNWEQLLIPFLLYNGVFDLFSDFLFFQPWPKTGLIINVTMQVFCPIEMASKDGTNRRFEYSGASFSAEINREMTATETPVNVLKQNLKAHVFPKNLLIELQLQSMLRMSSFRTMISPPTVLKYNFIQTANKKTLLNKWFFPTVFDTRMKRCLARKRRWFQWCVWQLKDVIGCLVQSKENLVCYSVVLKKKWLL